MSAVALLTFLNRFVAFVRNRSEANGLSTTVGGAQVLLVPGGEVIEGRERVPLLFQPGHRVGMLAPILRARGVSRIVHILPDGESIEYDESAVPSVW